MLKRGDYIKIIKTGLLFIALVFCFFLVYKVHFAYPHEFINPETATLVNATKYPFPFHNDEWAHLAVGLAIAEERKLNFNPYLAEQTADRELGFHLFLASIFLLPGINPVLVYQYLAPLFLAINALLLFFLVYKLTKNYWIGLFSILFFASIKSNLNILGNWFFTPLTFTLFMIFLYFYFFTKAIDSKKISLLFLALSLLIFLIGILIYPFAAILMVLVSIIYALTKPDFIKENWKYLAIAGVIGVIIVLVVVRLYFWTGTLAGTYQKFFSELIFKKGWTVLEHTYSLISFYGVVPLVLAVIGSIYLFLKKKNLLFIIWPGLLLLNLIIFVLFDFSLFFPYQRNFLYLLIGLAPLSAMGLYWIVEMLFNYSKKYVFKKKKYSTALCIILVIIILFFTFNNYYKTEPQKFSLHRVINQPEYQALLWLKNHYEPYNKVLTKPFLSATIYPISRNRVVGMMPSSLEGGPYARTYDFFNGNCDFKKKIVNEEEVNFVISSEELNCDFLGKVYYKDGVNIYKAV